LSKKVMRYVVPLHDEETTLKLQGDVVHVDFRGQDGSNNIYLWAEFDFDGVVQTKTFEVFLTGEPVRGTHVASVVNYDNGKEYHVYEV
jgi:hypothetical protein